MGEPLARISPEYLATIPPWEAGSLLPLLQALVTALHQASYEVACTGATIDDAVETAASAVGESYGLAPAYREYIRWNIIDYLRCVYSSLHVHDIILAWARLRSPSELAEDLDRAADLAVEDCGQIWGNATRKVVDAAARLDGIPAIAFHVL